MDEIRLVGTYHGLRMYVSGSVRSGQRDKTKGNWAGVVCPAGCIDNAGRAPCYPPVSYWYHKKSRLCIKENLIILIES